MADACCDDLDEDFVGLEVRGEGQGFEGPVGAGGGGDGGEDGTGGGWGGHFFLLVVGVWG